MTKEEIEKIVAESVRPLTEKFAGPAKKEAPVKEEKLYREGGLEEVPGTNNTVWRMPKPNKEECSDFANMINQGTLDIMNSPDKDPYQAIADGEAKRMLKGALK